MLFLNNAYILLGVEPAKTDESEEKPKKPRKIAVDRMITFLGNNFEKRDEEKKREIDLLERSVVASENLCEILGRLVDNSIKKKKR